MKVQSSNGRKKVILNVIYRLPYSNFSLNLQEIESLIVDNRIKKANLVYLDDFNMWVDDIRNNDAQIFSDY